MKRTNTYLSTVDKFVISVAHVLNLPRGQLTSRPRDASCNINTKTKAKQWQRNGGVSDNACEGKPILSRQTVETQEKKVQTHCWFGWVEVRASLMTSMDWWAIQTIVHVGVVCFFYCNHSETTISGVYLRLASWC